VPSSDTNDGQLKVVDGALSLSSSSLATPVEVPAGMCLGAVDGADGDANPISLLQADVCQ